LLVLFMVAMMLAPAQPAHARGCIVARPSSQTISPESQGGDLQPGDGELSIGYWHQCSYKHFVGDVEQTYRVQQGTDVMSKINLQDVQLNYQLTDRIGFGLTLPILFASRRSNNSYYTLHSAGISDAAVLGQVWLWNPKHARRGNINLGFGFQAPSGNDHVTNNVLTSPTARRW
jgi:hypothetical protein